MNKNEKQRKVEAEGEKGVSSAEKREEERTVSHSCENLQYIISNSNPEVRSDDCCTRRSVYIQLCSREKDALAATIRLPGVRIRSKECWLYESHLKERKTLKACSDYGVQWRTCDGMPGNGVR
jgi:thymidylate synthase